MVCDGVMLPPPFERHAATTPAAAHAAYRVPLFAMLKQSAA